MAKVLILAEGQTEETFVRNVLEPHLRPVGVSVIPKLLMTKRLKDGTQFKGGVRSYEQIRGDLLRLLKDSSASMVTTMIDYYGVPKDFPGYKGRPTSKDPYVKVRHLEKCFEDDIDNERFLPYFSLYEYEAILFSDLSSCGSLFDDDVVVRKLQSIRDEHETPEHINDGPLTAPSKRIMEEYPLYEKVIHGTLAADAIGLKSIREACRHFSDWLTRLESAGKAPPRKGTKARRSSAC